MSLSEETVRYVAKLAALALKDEEIDKLKTDLNEILNYFEQLNRVSTLGVLPTSHVHGVTNAFRDDIIRDSLNVEDVALNAPEFKNGGFRVPRIIG